MPAAGSDESEPATGATRTSIGRLVSPETEPTARKLVGALPPRGGAVPVAPANPPEAPGSGTAAGAPAGGGRRAAPAWLPASLPGSGAVVAGSGAVGS